MVFVETIFDVFWYSLKSCNIEILFKISPSCLEPDAHSVKCGIAKISYRLIFWYLRLSNAVNDNYDTVENEKRLLHEVIGMNKVDQRKMRL